MATNTTDTETISDAMDYAQHDATWHTFVKLVKWSVGIIAVLVIFLYLVINP